VKGVNGEILGVHSASDDEPAKKTNFSLADKGFEGKMKYSEWVFMVTARVDKTRASKSPPDALSQRTNP